MRTAGIDLSAQAKKTGVAIIEWAGARATVTDVSVGAHTDELICDLIQSVDKTGIDCPLGWPVAFVDYLVAHQAGGHDLEKRATADLTLRATDRHVIEVANKQPLRVSADKIAIVAMRCAQIQAELERRGAGVDRTGRTGPIVEVYPGAALKVWGLPSQGYKGGDPTNVAVRADLIEAIGLELDWLDLGSHAGLCVRADDALDAVLCGVVAGLAVGCKTVPIPEELVEAASSEGWIALPS